MHLIEEAYELLRKTKNGVSTPQAEGNPSDIRDVQKNDKRRAWIKRINRQLSHYIL